MTVSEHHSLYRRWPIRHRERLADGLEHLTYYYEGRLVRELLRHKTADKSERLKIDYCVATYNNELDNMSFILSLPVRLDDDKIYPESSSDYSPEELAALIRRYTDYRDVIEREILIEYVDYALDMLQGNQSQPTFCLVDALEKLRKKNIIRVPSLVDTFVSKSKAKL